jgi:phenylacetate-coenzyme A ligase PaaK-like adenylate-forming protein
MIIYKNPEKLKKLLSSVYNSPYSEFYKDKFQGIDEDKLMEEFERIPHLTRADIANTHPDKRLFIPKTEASFVSYTSGTTDGFPLVLYWSPVENYYFEPSLGTPSRTPLILHPALNKNFGHTFIQQCHQAQVPVTPVFADFQNLVHSAILADQTQADAIYTTPTIAGLIYEQIKKYYDPKKILLLVLFSENLTQTKRSILERQYPNAQIANVYASSEVGQILFYPCLDIIKDKTNKFHILKDAITALELADDGELIITMDQNKAFPLIRYKTGDYFELDTQSISGDTTKKHADINAPCTCGIQSPVLTWAGRIDIDRLRLNGVEIKVDDIEKSLAHIQDNIGDTYQLHFYSKEITDNKGNLKEVIEIVFEIVTKYEGLVTEFSKAELTEQIKDALLNRWQLTSNAVLQTAVDKGLFEIPQIRFVNELSVKTLKTRRLVNHVK